MTRPGVILAVWLLICAQAAPAEAGMFVALEQDRVDPSAGEQPTVVIAFDRPLSRATIQLRAESGSTFTKTWNFTSVSPGREYTLTWPQPLGEVEYVLLVEMRDREGGTETEEAYLFVASAEPLRAEIPPASVNLATRSFDLKTNHPPSSVEIEVMSDTRSILGSTTIEVEGAKPGAPLRVTWPQDADGNVFKVSVKAHDVYGYWAAVDIIPWTLSIPHEDVIFPSGSHQLLPEEEPKVDAAWAKIKEAVRTYGEWVECALYVGGYTDTVGDRSSNQGLSERRALTLARYFQSKGGGVPIYAQGFGESVLAVPTADGVDMEANRRALYLITAGPPPSGAQTPGRNWRKVR